MGRIRRRVLKALLASLGATFGARWVESSAEPPTQVLARLQAAVQGDQRPAGDRRRDLYRHPVETLVFAGIRQDMVVVELWPEGGWYTRILAPFLKPAGKLYLATAARDARRGNGASRLREEVAANPAVFGEPVFTVLDRDTREIAPAASADLVLTFRNVHSWMAGGYAAEAFRAAHRALKPGGALLVVEHRALPGPQDPRARSGYVTEAFVVGLAEAAGLRLAGRSEVNANPRDTRDHPRGVWSLPPNLALGDRDRERYERIAGPTIDPGQIRGLTPGL